MQSKRERLLWVLLVILMAIIIKTAAWQNDQTLVAEVATTEETKAEMESEPPKS